jgi:DNA-binding response OmpR family regulator
MPPSSPQTKPLILIVEDEKQMAELIAEHLGANGMVAQTFHTATQAERFLEKNFANLMLLDVNLPDASGFRLVENLQQKDITIPIIFLSGSQSESVRIQGLDLGGDDFVTKPFSFPELIARINAVLRRTETSRDFKVTQNARLDDEPFVFCGAQVNPRRMELIFPNGQTETIGKKELGILAYLVANSGHVLTRRALIHGVWGQHADVKSRSLDQYIVKIREAFSKNGCSLDLFRTIHGVGYILENPPTEN